MWLCDIIHLVNIYTHIIYTMAQTLLKISATSIDSYVVLKSSIYSMQF